MTSVTNTVHQLCTQCVLIVQCCPQDSSIPISAQARIALDLALAGAPFERHPGALTIEERLARATVLRDWALVAVLMLATPEVKEVITVLKILPSRKQSDDWDQVPLCACRYMCWTHSRVQADMPTAALLRCLPRWLRQVSAAPQQPSQSYP